MKELVTLFAIFLLAIGGGFLVRHGILYKKAEYRVAHALKKSGLPQTDQAVVMALVKHGTNFQLATVDQHLWKTIEQYRITVSHRSTQSRQVRKYAAEYELILSHMQARESATALEYLNSVKNGIVELTGSRKALLHFLLGNAIFFLATAVAVLFGVTTRRAVVYGLLAAAVLAFGNEIIDFAEALLNDKIISPPGILEDLVLSLAGPVCITLVIRRFALGTASHI